MERYQHCELRMDGIRTYLERNIPLQLLIRTILFDKKAPPLGGAFFFGAFLRYEKLSPICVYTAGTHALWYS